MSTRTEPNRLGLDYEPSNVGREADALNVAQTALVLRGHLPPDGRWLAPARHAVALHAISGRLHRLDERACNEDLTCQRCEGTGELDESPAGLTKNCPACAGKGRTTGRTEARLEAAASEIAAYYGLRVYFQGDPRGCSLYLLTAPDQDATTYNRCHAVPRLG